MYRALRDSLGEFARRFIPDVLAGLGKRRTDLLSVTSAGAVLESIDREGAAGPADIALAGDEKYLRSEIARLRDVGVTDFDAFITPVEPGADERTFAFLAGELGSVK